jgi:chemotaxis methyl-accepting protein methylase
MLIYFDDESSKEVALNFYDILDLNGYILLGHAEYMNRIVDIYKSNKIEDVLIYQKI